MSILTSSSQYLQPEYLSPSTPNQLDAKNSPLALLAATCNSIGKDSPNSKSLIPPLEKEKKRKEEPEAQCGRNSVSSVAGSCRSISPYSDKSKHDISISSPKRNVTDLKEVSKSPHNINKDLTNKLSKEYGRSLSVSPRDKPTENGRSSVPNLNDKVSSSNGLSTSTGTTTVTSSSHSNGYDSDKKGIGLPLSGLSSYPPLPLPGLGHLAGYPFSHLGASGAAAVLAAHKHSAESMKYQTVRTASGGTTLVPMCSDPYCAHCKLTLQAAQLSPAQCNAGCVQCTHDKSVGLPPSYPHPASLSAGLLGLPGLGSYPGLSPTAASSLFANTPTAGGNGVQPHVCSWISSSGSGVCGKRFTTSEELMQHLRSHTSSLESAAIQSGLSTYPPLSTSASLSSSLLRQAYGGRLSPGLLSASRFHPYLKSLSSLPGSEATLPPVHPSLGAYSLYSLYGHKLGVP